jgi:hypothetical protein
MRRKIWVMVWVLLSGVVRGNADAVFTLEPDEYGDAAIVVGKDADAIKRFAALELQEHLRLVIGVELPIVGERGKEKAFLIGVQPEGDGERLETEEARYVVTERAVYLYGDDLVRSRSGDLLETVVGRGARFNRAGTLFAVYDFLERELGVRWLEPGEDGVMYAERERLEIPVGAHRWVSHFAYQRNLRSYAWRGADSNPGYVPEGFVLTAEQAVEKRMELDLWLRRMRMGGKEFLQFGHAFSRWWEEYGEEHPEYFALNGRGKRGPLSADKGDRVKICAAEEGVVRQSVENWLERREGNLLGTQAVCVAQNDGGGGGADEFCHCDRCLALDVRQAGERLDDHLTDRYLNLANRTLAAAREEVPDALVTAYAYSPTLQPPRRERVADGVVLQFVTVMGAPFEETRALYKGWQARGAERLMFRPNDLCVELGLPLGHEERIFDHQQIAVAHGALGTDHDCVYGFWTGISGLTYYALAKSHVDPERSFADWEAEYAASFGAAQPELGAFFRHWREKFERVIYPAHLEMRETQTGSQRRGFLSWHRLNAMSGKVEAFYGEADFDVTDELLQRAQARDLTAVQRRQVRRLALANRHSRLTFRAMAAVDSNEEERMLAQARELLDFRLLVRDSLRYNWHVLFSEQHQMGDATGITLLMKQAQLVDRKSFSCVLAPRPPVVDGRLDEPFWEKGRNGVLFLTNKSAEEAQVKAEALLAHDADNLYVAVECREPLLNRVVEEVTERDGTVWKDNAVELFFDPQNSREDFYQFVVTSGGTLLDARKTEGNFDTGWNVDLETGIEFAVGKGRKSWVLEMRLPFRTIGMEAPQAGESIRFNITRDRVVEGEEGEATALSPTFGGFHMPQRFAELVFE